MIKDHALAEVDERNDLVEQLELKTLPFLDDVRSRSEFWNDELPTGCKGLRISLFSTSGSRVVVHAASPNVKSVKRNSFRTSLRTRRLLEQVECASVRHRPTGRNLGNALVIQ